VDIDLPHGARAGPPSGALDDPGFEDALFQKAAALFRSLAASLADGSHSKSLYMTRVDLLIVRPGRGAHDRS